MNRDETGFDRERYESKNVQVVRCEPTMNESWSQLSSAQPDVTAGEHAFELQPNNSCLSIRVCCVSRYWSVQRQEQQHHKDNNEQEHKRQARRRQLRIVETKRTRRKQQQDQEQEEEEEDQMREEVLRLLEARSMMASESDGTLCDRRRNHHHQSQQPPPAISNHGRLDDRIENQQVLASDRENEQPHCDQKTSNSTKSSNRERLTQNDQAGKWYGLDRAQPSMPFFKQSPEASWWQPAIPKVSIASSSQVIVKRLVGRNQHRPAKLFALLFLIAIGLFTSGPSVNLSNLLESIPIATTRSTQNPQSATCDNQRPTTITASKLYTTNRMGLFLLANAEANTKSAPMNSAAVVVPKKTPVPTYVLKPDPQVKIREGSALPFRCGVKEKIKHTYWTKNGWPLFDHNMSKADALTAERFTFIGDIQKHDYTIELRNAQVNDTGLYRCHAVPFNTTSSDNPFDFLITSNLTVEPLPTITQSPSALASEMDSHVEVSTHQLIQYNQRSATLTRLSPSTRLLSARNTSSTSVRTETFWPYLLLALAAVLMFTNIFIIYKIVKSRVCPQQSKRSDRSSPESARPR